MNTEKTVAQTTAVAKKCLETLDLELGLYFLSIKDNSEKGKSKEMEILSKKLEKFSVKVPEVSEWGGEEKK